MWSSSLPSSSRRGLVTDQALPDARHPLGLSGQANSSTPHAAC
jgi:hypothetical protein